MVRTIGCDVAVANGGEVALEFLKVNRVALVVLDISMPGMSGIDVLREMRAQGMLPGTPVIMFSASEEHREKALSLGAVGFILKHEADDLIEKIEQLLRCGGVPPESKDEDAAFRSHSHQ